MQDLAARGMGSFDFRQSFSAGPEVSREVTINAAAPQIRNHLTKRSTQDDIARRTGTSVVVRGRFMPPGSVQPGSEEQPLFLLVTPGLSKNEVGPCCTHIHLRQAIHCRHCKVIQCSL